MKQTKTTNNDLAACDKHQEQKEYTHLQEFFDNLPYFFMIILGSAIGLLVCNLNSWGITTAVPYAVYGTAGALWIIIFVCPYYHYDDTRTCPCGYGQIAAKLRKKSGENKFAEKFKKHIPVIVLLWIIPIILGTIFLIKDFNYPLLTLTIIFIINSYIILPLLARKYGCGHCPQKNNCIWMIKETSPTSI